LKRLRLPRLFVQRLSQGRLRHFAAPVIRTCHSPERDRFKRTAGARYMAFQPRRGYSGAAVGETSLTGTPSLSGNARQFDSTFTGAGGEIFAVSYANDTTSTNFVYDGWVWIESGSSIANLEMDSNQVTANGQTVIYAFQCSGYSNLWEYSGAGGDWVHSSQPCNLSAWQTNVWHHVQISYSRDDSGNVTYQSVWLDGTAQPINATVPHRSPWVGRWEWSRLSFSWMVLEQAVLSPRTLIS